MPMRERLQGSLYISTYIHSDNKRPKATCLFISAGKHSCLHSVSRSPFRRCDVLCAESKQRLLSPSPRGSCPSLLRDSCGGWSTSPPLPPLLVHDWSRPRGCPGASQPDAPCKPWQPLPLSSCPLSSKMMLGVKPSKTHCCCCCCC